jgi:hypothetical protein
MKEKPEKNVAADAVKRKPAFLTELIGVADGGYLIKI